MGLRVIDRITAAGSGVNEDRIGCAGPFAWVIDGATDVIEAPLTPAPTDADWIAGTLDAALQTYAVYPECAFADLPGHLTAIAAEAFAAVAKRQPDARHEHPSASGLVVKYAAGILSYFAISDCTLIVAAPGEDAIALSGVPRTEAGDAHLDDLVRRHQSDRVQEHGPATLLDRMRPELQAMRADLNHDDGYGVLSITPTPERLIRSGFLTTPPGTHLLLASDGFTRLVDVFQRYDAERLIAAARSGGLSTLLSELREIERFDHHGTARPRVKSSDDASAILIEVAS